MYAVQNDTEITIKFNIVLYIKVIFVGQGVSIRKVPIQPVTGDFRDPISGGYSAGYWHPRQYVKYICRFIGSSLHLLYLSVDNIEYIYNKIIKYIGIFYKLQNILPATVLRSIYFAFVHPHLLYGID